MPLLSRRRLQCFYCGKRSLQRYEYGLSKWKCEHCLADNYLDAHGEITEPPPLAAPTPTRTQRFAQLLPQSSQPISSDRDQSPFCQTCLNNQYLITQNLANYLPETTDPRYAEFEVNLPKYKQELEERYPPVCTNCENAVSKRIRAAGAFAKADYLRRMMEKTRAIGLTRSTWTSASILRAIGGLLWFFATMFLALWNGLGALADQTPTGDDLIDDQSYINLFRCIGEASAFGHVNTDCAKHAYHLAGWGIAASVATFWWNPIMHRRGIDRTTGLTEFYKLQTILIAARFGTWYLIGNENQHGFGPAMIRMIHAIMLAMNLGISLLAYCTPRIAKTPQITFHGDNEPLLTGKEGRVTHIPTSLSLSTNTQVTTTSASVSFPFSKVATTPDRERFHQQMIITEEELSPADAMDIDSPVPNHNFRPVSNRIPKTSSQEPSPFYGKLPPAPVSQEHRLRNPPNKPSFQKTSSERQDKFFQSMVQPHSDIAGEKSDPVPEFRLQEPRLVIKQDNQETGLENWFSSNVFSLGDPRTTVSHDQAKNSDQKIVEPELAHGLLRLAPIVSLLCGIGVWTTASIFGPLSSYLYQLAACIGAIVTASRFIAVISSPSVNSSDVLLCMAEFFGAVMLVYQIRQAVLLEFNIGEALGSFPVVYFAFMMMQECIIIITAYRRGETNNIMRNNKPKGQSGSLDSNTSLQPRQKKSLPLDNGVTLYRSQPSEVIDHKTDTLKQSKTKPTDIGGLGLGPRGALSGNNILSSSSRSTTRVLQARAPKPWEIGGI